ncbi:hypothetical protein K438DRAFT_1575238, partial [Mycena galopus ATCC 62051]
PTVKAVKLVELEAAYGAKLFRDALAQFIARLAHPTLPSSQIEAAAHSLHLPFNSVPVYHRIKFTTPDPSIIGKCANSIIDSVHAQPARKHGNGLAVPGRFDTVLINTGAGQLIGTEGKPFRLPRTTLIMIFQFWDQDIVSLKSELCFPFQHTHDILFPSGITPPKHLAYVEWFSTFTSHPEPHHLLYKIRRSLKNGVRLATIVPVDNIRRSVHLLPKFGPIAPREWTSSNVLDLCSTFFVNSLSDRHMYTTLY